MLNFDFERLGVGAPLPEKAADGSWNRTELSSNDKLRKQLLGRNYDKIMKASAANRASNLKAGAPSSQMSKTAAVATTGEGEGSDDDDEGRSTMVGKKRGKMQANKTASVAVRDDHEIVSSVGTDDSSSTNELSTKTAPSKRKKATSYLDELLAERSKKKKKK